MGILKRLVDFLAPCGFILAVAAFAWTRFQPFGRPLPGGLRPWLIAALALVLVHLILRWEDVARGLGRRQLKYGGNTLVLVLAVLAILGGLNWIAKHRAIRVDLTEGQRYSLSDQTKKVLEGLPGEVTITYFQRERDLAAGRERLKEYEARSDKLKVEYVDPVQSPARAEAYDVRGPWPILIVEHGDNRERISNDSEEDLTNALLKVTREGSKTVCFVEGEGERSPEDNSERGLSGAKTALGKSLYEVKQVFLLREKTVPVDCTVLVVAGPEKDLEPQATNALRDYVKGGGKALVMVEPPFEETQENIEGLLAGWSIEAGNDVVVDVSGMGQIFGANELAPLAMDYPFHAITKDFQLMTLFGGARSMQASETSAEGVTAQNLVRTSGQSWAESDVQLKGSITLDETSGDRTGPVPLAAVATVRGPEPAPTPAPVAEEGEDGEDGDSSSDVDEPKAPEGRVVAVGDVDFATNSLLGFQGNQDFFLNVVAWLAEDADLISIRPKEPEDQKLFLNKTEQQNVSLVALVVLPLLFVIGGVVTWWRRR